MITFKKLIPANIWHFFLEKLYNLKIIIKIFTNSFSADNQLIEKSFHTVLFVLWYHHVLLFNITVAILLIRKQKTSPKPHLKHSCSVVTDST